MTESQVSGASGPIGAGVPSFGNQPAAVIRRAAAGDAEVLAAVAAETFPLACPPDALPEAIADFIANNLTASSFAGYLADPDRELFLAEAGGQAAGYTMIIFGEPADPDVSAVVTSRPTAELSKVYVRAEHHGAGIAPALVAASVDAARLRGARSVWLGVNQQNERANRFYGKQGFERVGTKKFLVGQRYEDDFVRALEL